MNMPSLPSPHPLFSLDPLTAPPAPSQKYLPTTALAPQLPHLHKSPQWFTLTQVLVILSTPRFLLCSVLLTHGQWCHLTWLHQLALFLWAACQAAASREDRRSPGTCLGHLVLSLMSSSSQNTVFGSSQVTPDQSLLSLPSPPTPVHTSML